MKVFKPRESDQAGRHRSISGLSPNDMIPRRALEDVLMILGRAAQRAVIVDLETRGLYRNGGEYLEVGAVSKCLERYFGRKCTQLILVRVTRMDELNPTGALA